MNDEPYYKFILQVLRICGLINRNIWARKNIRPLVQEMNDLVPEYEATVRKEQDRQ